MHTLWNVMALVGCLSTATLIIAVLLVVVSELIEEIRGNK
jgi:hypothetical protein